MKFISVFLLVTIFVLSINAASTFLERRTKPPYFPASPPSCPICAKVRGSSNMSVYTIICACLTFRPYHCHSLLPLSILYWCFPIYPGLFKYQFMRRGCTSLGQFLYGLSLSFTYYVNHSWISCRSYITQPLSSMLSSAHVRIPFKQRFLNALIGTILPSYFVRVIIHFSVFR